MNSIDLAQYEKKMKVRRMRPSDFDAIIELQRICFPNMEPWKKEQLKSHLEHFSEGQFVVEYDDRVIGSCSSLIINFEEYNDEHSYDEITGRGYISNHDPSGSNLYGIEVMVHPEFRRMKIGRRLYEERKDLARKLNLKSILIGGRIPNYHKYADRMTPREYVEQVISHNIYDPVLTFQALNGFVLRRINPNYLDDDARSMNYATLMEWPNVDYRQGPAHRKLRSSYPVRICAIQYMMKKINSFEDFAQQVEYFTDVAASGGSDFAVFPEILTTQLLSFTDSKSPGDAVRRLADFTDAYLKLFSELAVKYNVNIIGGSHFIQESSGIYNVAYLFRRDGTIDKQYKLHITPNERKWWGIHEGNGLHVFDTDCGKIAILVCYDIEFPELARLATDMGANIIFVPFCTDDRQGYLRVRYCAQARAVENQVFVAIAGTVGNLTHVRNMDIQYAQSAIFAPSDYSFARDGIVGECNPNIEMVVIGDVNLEVLRRARLSGSVMQLKDRRLDLYETIWKGDS